MEQQLLPYPFPKGLPLPTVILDHRLIEDSPTYREEYIKIYYDNRYIHRDISNISQVVSRVLDTSGITEQMDPSTLDITIYWDCLAIVRYAYTRNEKTSPFTLVISACWYLEKMSLLQRRNEELIQLRAQKVEEVRYVLSEKLKEITGSPSYESNLLPMIMSYGSTLEIQEIDEELALLDEELSFRRPTYEETRTILLVV